MKTAALAYSGGLDTSVAIPRPNMQRKGTQKYTIEARR